MPLEDAICWMVNRVSGPARAGMQNVDITRRRIAVMAAALRLRHATCRKLVLGLM
jgi:hypothetical protein